MSSGFIHSTAGSIKKPALLAHSIRLHALLAPPLSLRDACHRTGPKSSGLAPTSPAAVAAHMQRGWGLVQDSKQQQQQQGHPPCPPGSRPGPREREVARLIRLLRLEEAAMEAEICKCAQKLSLVLKALLLLIQRQKRAWPWTDHLHSAALMSSSNIMTSCIACQADSVRAFGGAPSRMLWAACLLRYCHRAQPAAKREVPQRTSSVSLSSVDVHCSLTVRPVVRCAGLTCSTCA